MVTVQDLDKLRDDLHREIVKASILTTTDYTGEICLNKSIPVRVTYHNLYDDTYGVKLVKLIGVDTLTGELIVLYDDGYEGNIYYNDLTIEQLAKVYDDIVVHKNFTIKNQFV